MAHCRKNRAGRLEKNEWLLLLLTVATEKGTEKGAINTDALVD